MSVDEGDDAFAPEACELLAELLRIAAAQRRGARRKVGKGPPGEDRSGPRPRRDGEAHPFEQLAEVVGRGDVAEHAAARDVVARVARLAQVADDVVRVEVDGHAGKEQRASYIDIGLCKPAVVVVRGGDVEDPAALHQGVERVEEHAHEDDAERHLRVAAHEQRKDERALEVVRLEQQQKDDAHRALAALTDAAARQPDDVQIRYLQACACLAAGKTGQACSMMEELVQTYPANSLYRLGLWKCLCRDGHLQTALPHLVEAVRLTPRVLTLPDIRELAQTDTTQFRALRTALSHLQLSASATPSDRARLGYIAYWNGEKEKAKVLLQQAVDDLPNLSTPWLLLGEERKYRLLLLGAFRKNLFTVDLPEEPDMTAGWLLSLFYGMKFMDWYGHELLTFEKIEL